MVTQDVRAEIRKLLEEIYKEISGPDQPHDEDERVYNMGLRMGKRQVAHQLEAILGTPGYTRKQ